EFLPDDRDADDPSIGFGNEGFAALRKRAEDAAPILVVVAEGLPGIRIGEQPDDGLPVVGTHRSDRLPGPYLGNLHDRTSLTVAGVSPLRGSTSVVSRCTTCRVYFPFPLAWRTTMLPPLARLAMRATICSAVSAGSGSPDSIFH